MAAKAIGELFIRQQYTGHATRTIAREARECKLAEINNNSTVVAYQPDMLCIEIVYSTIR